MICSLSTTYDSEDPLFLSSSVKLSALKVLSITSEDQDEDGTLHKFLSFPLNLEVLEIDITRM